MANVPYDPKYFPIFDSISQFQDGAAMSIHDRRFFGFVYLNSINDFKENMILDAYFKEIKETISGPITKEKAFQRLRNDIHSRFLGKSDEEIVSTLIGERAAEINIEIAENSPMSDERQSTRELIEATQIAEKNGTMSNYEE